MVDGVAGFLHDLDDVDNEVGVPTTFGAFALFNESQDAFIEAVALPAGEGGPVGGEGVFFLSRT